MDPLLIQTIQGNGGGYVNSYTKTTASVVAGNTLILLLACGAADTPTFSDNKGNTWHTAVSKILSSQRQVIIAYAYNCVAGATTITVQFGVSQFADSAIIVQEWANLLSASDPFDQKASNTINANSNFYPSGTTPTTTQANELLIGAIALDTNSPGYTGDSAFTNLLTQPAFDLFTSVATQYEKVTGIGAYQWTPSNSVALHASVVLATFKSTVVTPIPSPLTPINPVNTSSLNSFTIQKRFYYKIYDTSQRYVTTWTKDVISDPNFRSVLNGGSGQLMVRLARPFDNFGEGVDVALQYRVELWVADSNNITNNSNSGTMWDSALWDVDLWDNPLYSFQKIFSGFISAYAPTIDNEDQYVDVTVLGFVIDTTTWILKDTSGNTTLTYTTQDPGTIMRDMIDKYRSDGGVHLNYVGNSIQTVGVNASYTFQFNTLKEAFDLLLGFCPNGWFYFIDPNGTVYLKQASVSADHILTIGKDLAYMQPTKRIENLINVAYLIGGGNPNLFNKYTRNGSVTTYGKFEVKLQNGQVTDNTTSDLIAKAKLDQFQSPETRTVLRIVDNQGENSNDGQDIETFKIGDTLQIKNLNYGTTSTTLWDKGTWDSSVWDYTIQFTTASVLTIVSIDYYPDYIEVEASTRLPEITRRIEQIDRLLTQQLQTNLPTVPTVRVV